jgi:hypothetical protein
MENLNILDIIRDNVFLEKLYPDGISNYFVGQVHLDLSASVGITIHCKDKPAIEVAKWGKWGVNYNVIAIELSSNSARHIGVQNWENNEQSDCKSEITKEAVGNDEVTDIKFYGDDWQIELKTHFGLLYQKSSVYTL